MHETLVYRKRTRLHSKPSHPLKARFRPLLLLEEGWGERVKSVIANYGTRSFRPLREAILRNVFFYKAVHFSKGY